MSRVIAKQRLVIKLRENRARAVFALLETPPVQQALARAEAA
jgi:uncharacterized protein (DUF1778 family)